MNRIQLMFQASQGAGKILQTFFGKKGAVRRKGELDLVTDADEAAEQHILQLIRTHFPQDAILSEEKGSQPMPDAEYEWIIDPLDGTTNFAQGFPHFAVSIGIRRAGQLYAGCIFDPMKGEFFKAIRGEGAFLNGELIQVGRITQLRDAVVVTGFPYDRRSRLPELLGRVERVLNQALGLRRLGAACLDLAYVAAGRLPVFYEDSLNPWDIAAGILLVEEAGGVVLDFKGQQASLETGQVIAGNRDLVKETYQHIICG